MHTVRDSTKRTSQSHLPSRSNRHQVNYDELLYRINKDKKTNKTSIDLETGQTESDHDTLRRLRRRQNDYTKALRSHSVFNHNRTISTQIEPVREGEYHSRGEHIDCTSYMCGQVGYFDDWKAAALFRSPFLLPPGQFAS